MSAFSVNTGQQTTPPLVDGVGFYGSLCIHMCVCVLRTCSFIRWSTTISRNH